MWASTNECVTETERRGNEKAGMSEMGEGESLKERE